MSYKEKAIERLREESKQGKYDRYGKEVKAAVLKALEGFIEQDEEFAQAIVEKDGSFEGCVAAVVKGCGSCISDIEAYRRAVGYYFPGATVRFKMEIDLIGAAAEEPKKKGKKKDNVQECEKDAGCEAVDKPEATASDGSLGGEDCTGETVKKKISLSLLDFM